jgi:ATP-binding cassette subfamily B protein
MADAEPQVGKLRALWYMTALAFKADAPRAALALITAAVGAAAQPLIAFLISRIVGAVVKGDEAEAMRYVVWSGAGSTLFLTCALLRIDLRFRIEESTAMLVDQALIAATAGMPGLEHHERPEHLDRLELVRVQRRALGASIGAVVENVGNLASIVTTTGLLASVDVRLLALPLFGVPSVLASAKARSMYHRAQERTAESSRRAEHLFELSTTGAPAKELRVFGLRDEIRRRFTSVTEEVDGEYDKVAVRSALLSTSGWLLFALAYVGSLALVATSAVRGRASAADVVLVVTLAGQVNEQVNSVFWMVGWLMDTLKSVGRFLRILDDAAASMRAVDAPAVAPERLSSGIDLVGVAFRYPGTEADVLRGVDLHVPAGSTVAVVGDNGAGKSTLIKLLCGFSQPTAGAVLVDGVDLRALPVDEWRSRMSAGFQDFARLELLARETVGVGSLPAIDDAGVVGAALDRAAAADVVQAMAQGLETQVGRSFEGGTELSGGQWQKLALGRAMMRERPLLLVLDEPTAALDADTEHALFERYAGAARAVAAESGGITVLVSHRFSTVRMADMIVVVGGGTVTEVGTHAELMAAAGVYAELYELQARAYR